MVHVALVPDGFRRWALKNSFSYFDAYLQGIYRLSEYLKFLLDYNDINIVSIYLSSLENMTRSKDDVEAFCHAEYLLCKEILMPMVEEYDIKFVLAGCIDLLPYDLQQASLELAKRGREKATNKAYLALAYDPEVEVKSALSKKDSLDNLLNGLWVKEYVDIFIRTGQGNRSSKFLPLQCAGHAKIYNLDKLFLEVDKHDIAKILETYNLDKKRNLVETVEDMIKVGEMEL